MASIDDELNRLDGGRGRRNGQYDFHGRARRPDPPDPGPPPSNENGDEPTAQAEAKKSPGFPPIKPISELKRADETNTWLWHGCLARGSVTLLSAYWKAGKTTFISYLLRAFHNETPFCGMRICPAKVLYISEESESRWAERRDHLGLTDDVCCMQNRPFMGKPDWGVWREYICFLRDFITSNPVDLLVLDTISKLWPVLKENDAGEVDNALMPLHRLTESTAVLLMHHLRKGDGKEATGSRGSGALPAFVDIILEMRRYDPNNRNDRRRVLTGYGRWDEVPEEVVCELVADKSGYIVHGDKQEVGDRDLRVTIARLLPNEPPGMTWQEIRDRWPRDEGLRTNRLLTELDRGVDAGEWHREGDGKKGSPFTFWVAPPPLF